MTIAPAPPFSTALRDRTAAVHAAAESAPFLLALSEGRVSRSGVVGLLQRLVPVYEALESVAAQWICDPQIAPLLVPGLERAARLRQDLALLGVAPGAPSPAADRYARRIREVGAASAPAYLAHHYTRYLGDLSGGQIIGAALRRSQDLELSFLAFPGLRGPAAKKAYRAHLDGLGWGTAQQDEAVAEADLAFLLNQQLAAELEAEVLP